MDWSRVSRGHQLIFVLCCDKLGWMWKDFEIVCARIVSTGMKSTQTSIGTVGVFDYEAMFEISKMQLRYNSKICVLHGNTVWVTPMDMYGFEIEWVQWDE